MKNTFCKTITIVVISIVVLRLTTGTNRDCKTPRTTPSKEETMDRVQQTFIETQKAMIKMSQTLLDILQTSGKVNQENPLNLTQIVNGINGTFPWETRNDSEINDIEYQKTLLNNLENLGNDNCEFDYFSQNDNNDDDDGTMIGKMSVEDDMQDAGTTNANQRFIETLQTQKSLMKMSYALMEITRTLSIQVKTKIITHEPANETSNENLPQSWKDKHLDVTYMIVETGNINNQTSDTSSKNNPLDFVIATDHVTLHTIVIPDSMNRTKSSQNVYRATAIGSNRRTVTAINHTATARATDLSSKARAISTDKSRSIATATGTSATATSTSLGTGSAMATATGSKYSKATGTAITTFDEIKPRKVSAVWGRGSQTAMARGIHESRITVTSTGPV